MTKLSDTQAVILANASQSFDGNVLPLPGSLHRDAGARTAKHHAVASGGDG